MALIGLYADFSAFTGGFFMHFKAVKKMDVFLLWGGKRLKNI